MSVLADLSATTVLLIAAPVAVALFVLVLVLYASARTRSPVAARLEREASRRDRARRRQEDAEHAEATAAPAAAPAAPSEPAEPGTELAIPEAASVPATAHAELEEARQARLVAPPVPARDPETAELDRRQFINKGVLGGVGIGLGIFGAAALAFAYPKAGGGFGGRVNARTTAADAITYLEQNSTPFYSGEGRFYVVPFEPANEELAKSVYPITFDSSMAAGVTVVYQKCAHLGCRVPFCQPSKWFECPCHGSQYNLVGERQRGPAPRGLSRFRFTVEPTGELVVDTSSPVDAPPSGVETTGIPESPNHCVAG